jgi:hypothetical protein
VRSVGKYIVRMIGLVGSVLEVDGGKLDEVNIEVKKHKSAAAVYMSHSERKCEPCAQRSFFPSRNMVLANIQMRVQSLSTTV